MHGIPAASKTSRETLKLAFWSAFALLFLNLVAAGHLLLSEPSPQSRPELKATAESRYSVWESKKAYQVHLREGRLKVKVHPGQKQVAVVTPQRALWIRSGECWIQAGPQGTETGVLSEPSRTRITVQARD